MAPAAQVSRCLSSVCWAFSSAARIPCRPVKQGKNIKVGVLLPQVGTRVLRREKSTYCQQEGPVAPHNLQVLQNRRTQHGDTWRQGLWSVWWGLALPLQPLLLSRGRRRRSGLPICSRGQLARPCGSVKGSPRTPMSGPPLPSSPASSMMLVSYNTRVHV